MYELLVTAKKVFFKVAHGNMQKSVAQYIHVQKLDLSSF